MATLTDRPEGEDHEHADAVERQDITVRQLEDVRPQAWSRAAGEWADLAAAATEARDHVQNVLLKLPTLAEYERTGKPVKYVQQTGWQGRTAEKDPDWYHAVGSFHYNTVAQVEVVPGPDGEPKTTIRYQTHVYDRYNWDANKATPVPAMGNVSDAQMARLHQSGQAKKYDMGGQSEVGTWNG